MVLLLMYIERGDKLYQVPLRFVSVGPDFTLCASRILCVFPARSNPGKEAYRRARIQERLYDARGGKSALSLILLDNDYVVASPIKPITLFKRLESLENSYIMATKKLTFAARKREMEKAAAMGINAIDESLVDDTDDDEDYGQNKGEDEDEDRYDE